MRPPVGRLEQAELPEEPARAFLCLRIAASLRRSRLARRSSHRTPPARSYVSGLVVPRRVDRAEVARRARCHVSEDALGCRAEVSIVGRPQRIAGLVTPPTRRLASLVSRRQRVRCHVDAKQGPKPIQPSHRSSVRCADSPPSAMVRWKRPASSRRVLRWDGSVLVAHDQRGDREVGQLHAGRVDRAIAPRILRETTAPTWYRLSHEDVR